MRLTFADRLVNHSVNERSAISVTVRFFDDSNTPEVWSTTTPTTVHWRLDNQCTGQVLQDWTSATPGTSVTLAITSAMNAIADNCLDSEPRQITVKVDDSLATQYSDTHSYQIRNSVGQT